MGKTIMMIGDIGDPNIVFEINKIIFEFTNEDTDIEKYHPFINIVKPIDGKILVDQIDDYVNFFTLSSFQSKYKIGIINDFNTITPSMQNKLLKTIEDNGEYELQIFITKHPNNILSTILSRVYVMELSNNKLNLEGMTPFFQRYVKTYDELEYLKKNEEIFLALQAIEKFFSSKEYDKAYTIYVTRFKKLDREQSYMIFRIILQHCYDLKEYKLAKKIIKYESRFNLNISLNAQMDAIMVNVLREFMW